jgi:hypothetical protein
MPHKVSAGYRLKEASIQRRCDPVLAAKRLARHLENMRKTYPDYEREEGLANLPFAAQAKNLGP